MYVDEKFGSMPRWLDLYSWGDYWHDNCELEISYLIKKSGCRVTYKWDTRNPHTSRSQVRFPVPIWGG